MQLTASFETERLLLMPTGPHDAAFVLELLNTPKWLSYIGDRNVRTEEEAKQYILTRMLPQLERLGFSNYTVIRKSDEAKIGVCGLYDRPGLAGIDLGFAFLPAYEGNGYAFEAASELTRAAAQHFKLEQLNAITTEDNISSQKLLLKLDFEFLEKIRMEGDDEELMLFIKVLRNQPHTDDSFRSGINSENNSNKQNRSGTN